MSRRTPVHMFAAPDTPSEGRRCDESADELHKVITEDHVCILCAQVVPRHVEHWCLTCPRGLSVPDAARRLTDN